MRTTHHAYGGAAPLVVVYSLNCVTLPCETIATVTPPRGKAVSERVALLVIDTFKPFKFRVYVVVHVCGGLRFAVSHMLT